MASTSDKTPAVAPSISTAEIEAEVAEMTQKDSEYALRRLGKVSTYAEAAAILRKHGDHQQKFFAAEKETPPAN